MVRIRRLPHVFIVALVGMLGLSGCYYSSSISFSVHVSTTSSPDTTFEGVAVDLESVYAVDNAEVYITAQDWTVTGAPGGSTWMLDDDGRDATFLADTPGTYTIRYRTWYYTNWDYEDCFCTTYTSYRESYVTVTVLPAPSI
jgi:hypothetical protein